MFAVWLGLDWPGLPDRIFLTCAMQRSALACARQSRLRTRPFRPCRQRAMPIAPSRRSLTAATPCHAVVDRSVPQPPASLTHHANLPLPLACPLGLHTGVLWNLVAQLLRLGFHFVIFTLCNDCAFLYRSSMEPSCTMNILTSYLVYSLKEIER
jgi:hypothetical protein